MRLMRRSRRICSAGTPRSPRARRDSAVSKPRPPRIWTSSSAISQAISEAYSLARAPSMRMSLRSSSAICEARSVTASRAKVVAAMKEILEPTASWSATGLPHCSRTADHSRAIFRHHLPAATQEAGRESRPVLSVVRAIFRPWPSSADAVGGGDADLVEAGDAVLDAAQAHEGVAVLDGDARRVRLHDEGGDAALVALALRHAGHDDQQVGDDAVGGPQLDAVEDVVVPLGHRGGGEAGGVGADVGLGEQEGADVGAGAARQETLPLLLRAELLQGLRHADRLVRREQHADRRAGGAGQRERLVVVHLGETETAVLGVDLHAEGAELLEPVDDLVGDARLALDAGGVDLRLAEVAELGEELLAALGRFVVRERVGVDEVEPEAAEEQFLGEAGLAPVLFPGGLRHLTGLPLGDGGT